MVIDEPRNGLAYDIECGAILIGVNFSQEG